MQRNTYGLRGPVVIPNGFAARPPPIRGPPPLQPPIIRGPPIFQHSQMRGPPPLQPSTMRGASQVRASTHIMATSSLGIPPIRVPFPKSGPNTDEPDYMFFIPNPGMRDQNPSQ